MNHPELQQKTFLLLLVAISAAFLFVTLGAVAAGVHNRREQRRIAELRDDVEALMKRGHDAMVLEREDEAEARFREAWIKVQGEPDLADYRTGVSGWLDHSRRAANRQRWKQRVPPREYDEARDEALFRSILPDPRGPDSIAEARRACTTAAAGLRLCVHRYDHGGRGSQAIYSGG